MSEIELLVQDFYQIVNSFNPMGCPDIMVVDGVDGVLYDDKGLDELIEMAENWRKRYGTRH